MSKKQVNKRKIFNDPIYGFISIPHDIIFDLIEHPYFQRLRRIKQLGMTHYVYPGALHTRFHHAMGAMHLMAEAIGVLRSKGLEISEEEELGASAAILLHDIGHGPFSHALEHSIVKNISHEDISSLFMNRLNDEMKGKLDLAIAIFRNKYKKKFLHQLVSSQLDTDRLDYLKRDSFFTGVSEGIISSDRIIRMLNVKNDELVIEAKGIYSIEKFIIARRLMYWQVYLHKTVLSGEKLLVNILKRAKYLAAQNETLFATPALKYFIDNNFELSDFKKMPEILNTFAELDDFDIMSAIKVWTKHNDKILSLLCKNLIDRHLYKIIIRDKPFSKNELQPYKDAIANKLKISIKDTNYFVFTENIENNAYNPKSDKINLLYKDGKIADIADAADQLNISTLSKPVKKYFLCFPKYIQIKN